jgi:hypothetical protein
MNMTDEATVSEENPHIYLPAGADALFDDPHLNHTAQAIVDWVGRRHSGMPINSALARERYGRPGKFGEKRRPAYDVAREKLLADGVTATDNSFKIGVRSKVYRLTKTWANRRRLRGEAYFKDANERGDGARQVPPWSRYCVDSLSYDMESAHLYILAEAGVDPDKARELVDACEFDRGGNSAGFNAITAEVDRVNPDLNGIVGEHMTNLWRWRCDRSTWARRDNTQNRLHTPITNMAHELRPFLGFGHLSSETELWQIDAKNSQPLLLAALCLEDNPDSHDAKDLADICSRGEFYEETYLAVHGRYPSKSERKAWKPEIMKLWLYGPVGAMNDKKLKGLRVSWPTVHAWIKERKEKFGESSLPNEMGYLESRLWIDNLTPILEKLHIPAFTVHDSVIVPKSHVGTVRAEVLRVYEDEGLPVPRIEPEAVEIERGALEERRLDRLKPDKPAPGKRTARVKKAVAPSK